MDIGNCGSEYCKRTQLCQNRPGGNLSWLQELNCDVFIHGVSIEWPQEALETYHKHWLDLSVPCPALERSTIGLTIPLPAAWSNTCQVIPMSGNSHVRPLNDRPSNTIHNMVQVSQLLKYNSRLSKIRSHHQLRNSSKLILGDTEITDTIPCKFSRYGPESIPGRRPPPNILGLGSIQHIKNIVEISSLSSS